MQKHRPLNSGSLTDGKIANTNPNPGAKAPSITLAVEDYEEIVAYFRPVDFAMYVPNAFSPNNDGLNDAFLPVGNAFKTESYHLMVMNRWGEVVFESFDPGRALDWRTPVWWSLCARWSVHVYAGSAVCSRIVSSNHQRQRFGTALKR